MSEIITDKLTGRATAGDVTITSEGGAATMQLQQGVVKVWVNFNGTGTIATRDSFNVASLTDNGAGNYDVNHTNNMDNANFNFQASTDTWIRYNDSYSTSSHRPRAASNTFTAQDGSNIFTSVHGDLA